MRTVISFIFTCLFCISVQAKSGFPDQLPTITPSKLELIVNQHTDPYTIHVDFILHIPQHYIPSCSQLLYSPRLVAHHQEYLLKPILITGKHFGKKLKRDHPYLYQQDKYKQKLQVYADGDSMRIRINQTVPFELWMTDAKFVADLYLEKCDGESRHRTQTLADGILYLPLGPGPVRVEYVTKEINTTRQDSFQFYYPVNVSYLRPSYSTNQEELNRLSRFLRQFPDHPRKQLEKIEITGYTSPDGSLLYNERLSLNRALHFKQYLETHCTLPPVSVKIKTSPADWNMFAKAVENSSLKKKTRLLNIINNSGTDKAKEATIRRFSSYPQIRTSFYPLLQKISCIIFYTQKEQKNITEPE